MSHAEVDSRSDPVEILGTIVEIAADKLDWTGPVEPQMRLVEDLRLDSIRLLTLAMEVEDRFRICLDESDEAGIATVGDLIALIQDKLHKNEPHKNELQKIVGADGG